MRIIAAVAIIVSAATCATQDNVWPDYAITETVTDAGFDR